MNRTGYGGFRWVRNKYVTTSGMPRVQLPVADDYGTALYLGDPVKVVDGHVEKASPGDDVYGIFDGVKQYYNSSIGALQPAGSYPASVSYDTNMSRQTQVYVIPVRGQIFRAVCDENTTATTQALYQDMVQENVEWTAGTATGDRSGALLDISTNNTTNTLSVRIENVPDLELTNFAGTGVELEVSFNLIQDTASGSTTGTTT